MRKRGRPCGGGSRFFFLKGAFYTFPIIFDHSVNRLKATQLHGRSLTAGGDRTGHPLSPNGIPPPQMLRLTPRKAELHSCHVLLAPNVPEQHMSKVKSRKPLFCLHERALRTRPCFTPSPSSGVASKGLTDEREGPAHDGDDAGRAGPGTQVALRPCTSRLRAGQTEQLVAHEQANSFKRLSTLPERWRGPESARVGPMLASPALSITRLRSWLEQPCLDSDVLASPRAIVETLRARNCLPARVIHSSPLVSGRAAHN